jgi:hypothetical protein
MQSSNMSRSDVWAGAVTVLVFMAGLFTASQAQASCRWAGTAPICNGRCSGNEIQLEKFRGPYVKRGQPSFGSQCLSGTKALCCTRCPTGLVWREQRGNKYDTICVTPQERAKAQR